MFATIFALIGLIILIKSLAAPNPNLIGDLDNNNKVDIVDLSKLLSDFGSTDPTKIAEADIVKNNAVDIFDLSALLAHFGESVSGGGGSTSYDQAISYSAPANRPAHSCTRTVNVI